MGWWAYEALAWPSASHLGGYARGLTSIEEAKLLKRFKETKGRN